MVSEENTKHWSGGEPVRSHAHRSNRGAKELASKILIDSSTQKKLSQQMLGEAIGLPKTSAHTVICTWEAAENNIDPVKLGNIIEVLECNRDQAVALAHCVRPEISSHWAHSWYDQQAWQCFNFPAFDPEWLATQEEAKQAGLLLRDFRERADMTQRELAPLAGVKYQTVGYWERGKYPLPSEKLPLLVAALKLDPNEAARFEECIQKSSAARKKLKMTQARTDLGSLKDAKDILTPDISEAKTL